MFGSRSANRSFFQWRSIKQPLRTGHCAGLQGSGAKDWKSRLNLTCKHKVFGLHPPGNGKGGTGGRTKSLAKLNLIVSAGRTGGECKGRENSAPPG